MSELEGEESADENTHDFDSLGHPFGTLLAHRPTRLGPLAYSLVVIDPFSRCRNPYECDPGLSEEHSFLSGEAVGL